MTTTSRRVADCEFLAVRGGWMARSTPGSPLQVAVIGESKEEARLLFDREVAAWEQLREDRRHEQT